MNKAGSSHSHEEPDMNDPYLWDGSGEPDPELQRFEALLSQFRQSDLPLALWPAPPPAKQGYVPGPLRELPWLTRFAAAAMVVIALIAGGIFAFRPSPTGLPAGPGWEVARLDGTPRIGNLFITSGQSAAKLRIGQTLETNSSSRASISDTDLGEIKVEPNSRLRLLQTDAHRKRLQLDVGTIHATIWAPPGEFIVDTPSAVAVDLGCAYTLQVSPDGSGTIRTTLGWVGFHLHGHESFIPAGAMCPTRPQYGPGTPYFEDASESFRSALADFDFAAESSEARAALLETVLWQARAKDGLTLWHLLSRTSVAERAKVYDRFAALVPPPPGVTRDGILHLDQSMLDPWWNALNLGDIYLWRYWEQSASLRASPPHQLQKEQFLLKQAP